MAEQDKAESALDQHPGVIDLGPHAFACRWLYYRHKRNQRELERFRGNVVSAKKEAREAQATLDDARKRVAEAEAVDEVRSAIEALGGNMEALEADFIANPPHGLMF